MRSEQGLFREVVKHLNQVEEQVLESLAWTSASPLWESLRGAKDQVPACQQVHKTQQTGRRTSVQFHSDVHVIVCVCVCVQVMPPQYLEQNDDSSSGSVPLTPISHRPDLSTSSTLKGVCITLFTFHLLIDSFIKLSLTRKSR